MLIFSCSYGCESEYEKIDKYYSNGLFIVNNYIDIDSVLLSYDKAYDNFKNAAKLGHISSMYHMAFLHEIAAEYGHKQGSKTIAEHLSSASHYYGVCAEHNFPRAEEALIRIIRESNKKIKHIADDDSRNVPLDNPEDGGILRKFASIFTYSTEKPHYD